MIRTPSYTDSMRLSSSGGRSPTPSLGRRSPSPSPSPRSPSLCPSSPFERHSLSGTSSPQVRTQALPVLAAEAPVLLEAPTLADALQDIEIFASAHTNTFTLLQCQAQFGLPHPAPALQVASEVAEAEAPVAVPDLSRVQSLGACLSTPVDPDRGSRTVAAQIARASATTATTSAYKVQEEMVQCVDRWVDWVRRIRRKRRIEQVQALLATLPCSAFWRDHQSRALNSADDSVDSLQSGSFDEVDTQRPRQQLAYARA